MKAFRAIRAQVFRIAPDLARVRLSYCPDADYFHGQEDRVYAHVGHKPLTICVARAFEDLPDDNQRGILWHEFGHLLLDHGYIDGQTDYDEANADYAVYEAFGIEIAYDDENIQSVR